MADPANKTTAEWCHRGPLELIATYGQFLRAESTTICRRSRRGVFDYIVHRMHREKMDAMLDAEIGA